MCVCVVCVCVCHYIDTDDWSNSGTGNSLGVQFLVNEACTHVSNFAEILSKMSATEVVAVSLCDRIVTVVFAAIGQYCKQLKRPLRDILRKNVSVVTGRSSPAAADALADGYLPLGQIITPDVMVVLHNFLYLRSHLDYIMDHIALTCLKHDSRQNFTEQHQDAGAVTPNNQTVNPLHIILTHEAVVSVQHKLRRRLSGALLMVTDAAAQYCIAPACTAALMDAGDVDDRCVCV